MVVREGRDLLEPSDGDVVDALRLPLRQDVVVDLACVWLGVESAVFDWEVGCRSKPGLCSVGERPGLIGERPCSIGECPCLIRSARV